MDIKPFVGFAGIRFGLTEEEVIAKLGPATNRETESFEDGTNDVSLKYEKLGVDITFYSGDDFKLGTITFFAKEYTFLGHSLIGEAEADLVAKAAERGMEDLELEDDFKDLDSKDYFSEKNGVSFWLLEGKVDSITIFPEYGDDDEIVWPS